MFKKKSKKLTYNKELQEPILKCSICTGEKMAGFKNIQTGKFEEVMLVRDDKDLQLFKSMYDIAEVKKEY